MRNDKYFEPGRAWYRPELSPVIKAAENLVSAEADISTVLEKVKPDDTSSLAFAFWQDPDGLAHNLAAKIGEAKHKAAEARRVAEHKERARVIAAAGPAKEDSLYREKVSRSVPGDFAAPVRKEDWTESEDFPGIFVNASGEVMDGASRKVRALSTGFNPKTRKFSTRVWLNNEHGYAYHMNLLVERARLRKPT